MATTAGSTFPMAPKMGAGAKSAPLTVIPLDVSETISLGDVLVVVAATNDLADSNSASGGIFGIALAAAVTIATVDRDAPPGPDLAGDEHVINVALATPGTPFLGNMVENSTPNDHTGVYADDLRRICDIEQSTEGFACLADTVAATVAFSMKYASPQYLVSSSVWQHGRSAGVNIINPRVEFVFTAADTVFG